MNSVNEEILEQIVLIESELSEIKMYLPSMEESFDGQQSCLLTLKSIYTNLQPLLHIVRKDLSSDK